jgi:hypothetical protein
MLRAFTERGVGTLLNAGRMHSVRQQAGVLSRITPLIGDSSLVMPSSIILNRHRLEYVVLRSYQSFDVDCYEL